MSADISRRKLVAAAALSLWGQTACSAISENRMSPWIGYIKDSTKEVSKFRANSVAELVKMPRENGSIYETVGYYKDAKVGGAQYIFLENMPKSLHNGGTIISPTVPWASSRASYLKGYGEADPTGLGCFFLPNRTVTADQFGAVKYAGGNFIQAEDSWPSLQAAISYLSSIKGSLFIDGNYRSDYALFVGDDVNLYGAGPSTGVFFLDPTQDRTGRGGFVFGAWYEADPAVGLVNARAGIYRKPENKRFVEPQLGSYLRDNISTAKCRNSSIRNLRVGVFYSRSGLSGGYALNFVNAAYCSASNIWADGWTEVVNIGSDVPPSTPSSHECHVSGIRVKEPDNVRCYYALGFIANSTNCSISDSVVENWSDDPQTDGVYMVGCEQCRVNNLVLLAGTKTISRGDARGVVIQGGRKNEITNVIVDGLHNAVSFEPDRHFTNLPKDWNEKNQASDISSRNCKLADIRVSGPMYAEIRNIKETSGPQQLRGSRTTAHVRTVVRRGWVIRSSDGNKPSEWSDSEFGARAIDSVGIDKIRGVTPNRVGDEKFFDLSFLFSDFHTISTWQLDFYFGPDQGISASDFMVRIFSVAQDAQYAQYEKTPNSSRRMIDSYAPDFFQNRNGRFSIGSKRLVSLLDYINSGTFGFFVFFSHKASGLEMERLTRSGFKYS